MNNKNKPTMFIDTVSTEVKTSSSQVYYDSRNQQNYVKWDKPKSTSLIEKKLDGKKVKPEKAYEQAFREGYFSGLTASSKNVSYEKMLVEGIGKNNSDYLKGKILFENKENNIEEKEFSVLSELKDIVKYCELTKIIESGLNKALTLLNMRKFLNVNNNVVAGIDLFQTATFLRTFIR